MYKILIRPLLFLFDPELIHRVLLKLMKICFKVPLISQLTKSYFSVNDKSLEKELFGLKFKKPIGLAAGFDKDAEVFRELSIFGFGFIEIGTITPKPQLGNPKKRLFRLKEDFGIINRMGFNNDGVEAVVRRLKNRNKNIIIGGNIGKNKITPNDKAFYDYKICFEALFDYVDYFVVNVSSPNTPKLRELQEKEPLQGLLNELQSLNQNYKQPKPILLKIAPDLTDDQLLDIIDIVQNTKISGVIATNTTLHRDGLQSENKKEVGGLSGLPLTNRSTEVIRFLADKSNKSFPIIGVGGVHSAKDALDKINAGADLIQIYTGFIYEGPSLIKKINKQLQKKKT